MISEKDLRSMEAPSVTKDKEEMLMSKNTFARYIKNMPNFIKHILSASPDYIVPVEKKGCKLLRSSRLAQKEIREKVRYLQYFQNNNIDLTDTRVAVIDDATKFTSMLCKYREFFENKGAIVSTYSFVGQEMLKTAEREQFDPKAIIYQYLEESTYQEYIIQQSQFFSIEENFFDIDHFVIRAKITPNRYEKLLFLFNTLGSIEFTNDVYTPTNIEKISLFDFQLPSAESIFPCGITKGILQKIRFVYNRDTQRLTCAPLSFPIWDSNVVNGKALFSNVPFELPYEQNDYITSDALFFNICYAFHLYLLKSLLNYFKDFTELQNYEIVTRDMIAYIGYKRVGLIMQSAKQFLSHQVEEELYTVRKAIPIPQKSKKPFTSILEIMQELRYKYEELVSKSKSLIDVRYFLSYEEIVSRYIGRPCLMKWIDILCDRGVLVARNYENQGIYYRACRSGEGDYDHIEKKSNALLPVAINACGKFEKSKKGEFFRINSMYLNKIIANLVYDYPAEDYDFHAFFTKPHFFGPLTYLKDQLDNEKDIPIYDADQISKYCTYDKKNKEYVAYNLKKIRKVTPEYFGQGNAVPYTEIISYLTFLKSIRNLKGTDNFLNSIAICRDEDIYYRHVYHNLITSYRDISSAKQSIIEHRKECLLRDSAINISSAKTKLKYNQREVYNFINDNFYGEIIFDRAQEKIANSFVPFSDEFVEQKIPVMKRIVLVEYLVTNLMLFDTLQDNKYLRKFIKSYNNQQKIRIENFEYYLSIAEENRKAWNEEEYLLYKDQVEKTICILVNILQNHMRLLPKTRDKDYILEKRRRTLIYITNKSERYLKKNNLNKITILYYSFYGYRNWDNKKNIDVVDTIQATVAKILADEMNAQVIFGATGSEEYGTIIFDSVYAALDFSRELTQVFSLEGSLNKIVSQISFRFGCACRTVSQGDSGKIIQETFLDARKCATIEPKSLICNRLLISQKTKDILSDVIDFTQFFKSNLLKKAELYYEYKGINNEDEQVINYETYEYTDEKVKIGIITALLDERTAMKQMITDIKTISFPGKGAGHQFQLGRINAYGGGEHTVVLARTMGDGNNKAAIRAEKLIRHFPELEVILMVGIAGGTPIIMADCPCNNPDILEQHVRLGDIVVSDSIIQYDYKKDRFNEVKHDIDVTFKGNNIPPSAVLMQAKNTLDENLADGRKPWEKYIEDAQANLADTYMRPHSSTDVLYDYDGNIVNHPIDENRAFAPYLFSGKIASSNTVLKDPRKRDDLKRNHGVYAIEMEASGIADTTWESGIAYYVIRGISDYCDSHKNNKWHKYAALAAAAYAKALIEKVRK